MVLLVLYLLEYMIPYSRNVKWIENSTSAFYQAESWIEDWLYFFKTRTDISTENLIATISTAPVSYWYETISWGTIIPSAWFGDSDFDTDYNTIAIGKPLQLMIGNARITNWDNVDLFFKVPDIDASIDETLDDTGISTLINWQLTSQDNVLNALENIVGTTNTIVSDDICAGDETSCTAIILSTKNWIDLNGNTSNFATYYNTNCTVGKECSLKLSVIRPLQIQILESGTLIPVPYLEYKINFGTNTVPLRFSQLSATGKSYGFQKSLKLRVPQQTTNEAFDFTVFQ